MCNRTLNVLSTLVACMLAASAVRADVTEQARRILQHSGVKGGLIVHLGCGDGKLTAALRGSDRYLVQGLDIAPANIDQARQQLRSSGPYGPVSVKLWDGRHLPYADNLVNLIVSERPLIDPCIVNDRGRSPVPRRNPLDPCIDEAKINKVPMAEVMRVLAPLGVACIKTGTQWTTIAKPRPAEMDEWTHYLYNASGNVAGHDRLVGPPRHLRWHAEPVWNRGTKTSCLVSSGGRIFYILDAAHFAIDETDWSLLARDAFNGTLLWKRSLASWDGGGNKKIGPIQIHRKLIAKGERIYVTLGAHAPVSVLDAATGDILREFAHTQATEEMILVDGVLLALVNRNKPAADKLVRRGRIQALQSNKTIVALEAETGTVLWQRPAELVLPLTLAADSSGVLFHDGESIVCLDLKTGKSRWRSQPTDGTVEFHAKIPPDGGSRRAAFRGIVALSPQYGPTLMKYRDIVAFAGGHKVTVLAAADGRKLWSGDCPGFGYSVPVDVLGIDDLLWTPDSQRLEFIGRDLHTGELKKKFQHNLSHPFPHHRCYRMKATDHTILASRAGVEFVDLDAQSVLENHWVRGSCLNGIMPCNGLLYAPPHNCVCYIRAKLAGFHALASEPAGYAAVPGDPLHRGPAYGEIRDTETKTTAADWPTYRCNPRRSGATPTTVPVDLRQRWQTTIGGKLSSPVIAAGKVFVAAIDAHRVHALDAQNGKLLWSYTAGGRVDSPPTFCRGLVLFGSADGSVHCLRATDGALVWRFRAAPQQYQIVAREQLESPWPVSGSVLVVGDTVYFAAGRSSYLDGGISLYRLNVHTGEQLSKTQIFTPNPQTGAPEVDERGIVGDLPDVLSCDGDSIYMRHRAFDLQGTSRVESSPHLHSPGGFLDDRWHVRSFWVFAREFNSPSIGAYFGRAGRARFPSGRILVCDDTYVYGYGRNLYPEGRQTVGTVGRWCLFATTRVPKIDLETQPAALQKLWKKWKGPKKALIDFRWREQVPVQVWGLVLAGDTLFLAGPSGGERGKARPTSKTIAGNAESLLWAVSASDGRKLSAMKLPSPPVWDGLAAAQACLYVSTRDGRLLCLGQP